jgi:DNA-binding NarL/FixJ family response regulator
MSATVNSREASSSKKKRVFVIDDQPIVRERLAEIIESEKDLERCGEADDVRQAIEQIAQTKCDLVITGLSFKYSHGVGLIKDLRARFPRLRVLVFSIYDETLYGERAIRAGARGFVEKRAPTRQLLAAIQQVLRGDVYLSDKVAGVSMRRFFGAPKVQPGSPLEKLSDRELEVLELIGRGRSTRQIATALRVDMKTIETYRGRIKVKLKLANAAELSAQARRYMEESYSPSVR